jgi:hypothetical protein
VLIRDFSDFQPDTAHAQRSKSKKRDEPNPNHHEQKKRFKHSRKQFNKNVIGNVRDSTVATCRVKVKKTKFMLDQDDDVDDEVFQEYKDELLFDRLVVILTLFCLLIAWRFFMLRCIFDLFMIVNNSLYFSIAVHARLEISVKFKPLPSTHDS